MTSDVISLQEAIAKVRDYLNVWDLSRQGRGAFMDAVEQVVSALEHRLAIEVPLPSGEVIDQPPPKQAGT